MRPAPLLPAPLLIVAHGQPSAPAGPEAEIAALARAVAAHLPGRAVRGATLAAPGALEAALAGLHAPLVFPFFVADGWFIREALPARLATAGAAGCRVLPPFGLLPETGALALRLLRDAARAGGWAEAETLVLLAAHGSGRSPRPAESARALAARIAAEAGFGEVRTGFIEEPPFLAEAARGMGRRALCLPLFVARWDHVTGDLPAALAGAGFKGRLLPPLGADPSVPALIAGAVRQAEP